MYCFWCGADMVVVDNKLRCAKTGMGLSRVLQAELQSIYDPSTPKPVEGQTKLVTSGWYCPGCGERIDRTCSICQVTLGDGLIQQFVELHPHIGLVNGPHRG